MTYNDLTSSVSEELLKVRRINTFVNSKLFRSSYPTFSEEVKRKIQQCVKDLDEKGLNKLVQDNLDLSELGIRKLRQLARTLGVIEWYSLPKSLLLMEIQREQTRIINTSNGTVRE